MREIRREMLEMLEKKFTKGTRVSLVRMNDPYSSHSIMVS